MTDALQLFKNNCAGEGAQRGRSSRWRAGWRYNGLLLGQTDCRISIRAPKIGQVREGRSIGDWPKNMCLLVGCSNPPKQRSKQPCGQNGSDADQPQITQNLHSAQIKALNRQRKKHLGKGVGTNGLE
jgi:hypothetical protein